METYKQNLAKFQQLQIELLDKGYDMMLTSSSKIRFIFCVVYEYSTNKRVYQKTIHMEFDNIETELQTIKDNTK